MGTFFPGELTNHVSPELVSHARLGIVTGLLAVVVPTVVAVVVVVVAVDPWGIQYIWPERVSGGGDG